MSTKKIKDTAWPWGISLGVYLLGVFLLSHMTNVQLMRFEFNIWDKLAHFVEYLPIGFLVAGLLRVTMKSRTLLFLGSIAVAIVFGFGCLDELHQYFVPTRQASGLDILADVLGGVAGASLAFAFFRVRQHHRQRQLKA